MIFGLYVQGESYKIDEGIEVIATPGHSGADISLIVQNTTDGTILVAGTFSQSLQYVCVLSTHVGCSDTLI